jgi:Fur family peroxide stress response transcriptional regulator
MQKEAAENSIPFFIKRCKALRLKVTPQRIAIYRALLNSKEHPSADSIFQSIHSEYPFISFDTVNRTLLTFSQIGIIDVIESVSGVRRYDPNLRNHHHIHCIGCGEISDFYHEEYEAMKVPEPIQRKYTIINKRVVLSVLCARCRKEKRWNNSQSKNKPKKKEITNEQD